MARARWRHAFPAMYGMHMRPVAVVVSVCSGTRRGVGGDGLSRGNIHVTCMCVTSVAMATEAGPHLLAALLQGAQLQGGDEVAGVEVGDGLDLVWRRVEGAAARSELAARRVLLYLVRHVLGDAKDRHVAELVGRDHGVVVELQTAGDVPACMCAAVCVFRPVWINVRDTRHRAGDAAAAEAQT